MAAITASMVAELRGKTDAPMMECKKALTEAAGDMAKAEELLRVKLGSKAGKAASRVTAEGVVVRAVSGNTGALLEVNCETDFVTKNDSFLALAQAAADLIVNHNPADVAALGALAYQQDGFGPTLEDVRKGLIGKIGENMSFRRFKRYADGGALASYLHGTRIGVLVEYQGSDVGRVVLHDQLGGGLGQRQEAVVLGHEVGFAVHLHQRTDVAVNGAGHHAFGRHARGRLAGLATQLDAQQFLGLGHVATGLGQGLLAFHHRRVGLGAQFSNHACGDSSHLQISIRISAN